MAHVSKTAVSRLIAKDSNESEEPKTRSREDFKKLKELEEARKLGNAPAAVDEEGKDINPHIPQYISDAPWYLDPRGPTLKHQRQQEEKIKKYSSIHDWYKKGVDTSKIVTKFRKGACENCGAMTHKKKDCLERPRKVGAKYSGANFAPDEFIEQPSLAMNFDGKRDRWNGYDPESHQEVVAEYAKMEEIKRELKKEKLNAGLGNPEEDDGAPSSDEDEDKYVDKMDMVGTKVDAAERYTVRNLRIREDTAKYLRNLDPNSAYYDPKTRAMRKNPYEGTGKTEEEVDYAGDNFMRISGDTVDHAKSTLFAWEAGAKGLDVHALAEPTKLEALRKEYSTKTDEYKNQAKQSVLEKYGGLEHLEAPPRELIFAQSEDYVEYSRHGKVLKGEENPIIKSKYEEDVKINNHTAIWGSHWEGGKWGFKCCHSFVKNSYCTGEAGKGANKTSLTLTPANSGGTTKAENEKLLEEKVTDRRADTDTSSDDEEAKAKKRRREKKKEKKKRKKKEKDAKKKKMSKSSSSNSSNENEESKKEKDFENQVAEAMKKQIEEERKALTLSEIDERKRPYNSVKGVEDSKQLTDAELEAYYRKRQRAEDPMAQFLGQ